MIGYVADNQLKGDVDIAIWKDLLELEQEYGYIRRHGR